MPFNRRGGGSSSGGGSSFTGKVAKYNASPPTLADGDLTELQTDSKGTEYVNPGVYNSSSYTHTAYTGSASSFQVLAANPARTALIINNQDGTNAFWVNLSGGAAAADGTCIKVEAKTTFIPPYAPTTAITAFASTGSPVGSFIQSS